MEQDKLVYELDLHPASVWLFATPAQNIKNHFAHVQEVGDFHAKKQYFTSRRDLDSFLIKYTVSGDGYLEYDGKCYTLGPGHAFWIDCRNAQYYSTAADAESWHVLWVHFSGGGSREYYEYFLSQTGGSPVVKLSAEAAGVAEKLQSLINIYRESGSALADLQASGFLNGLWVDLISAAARGDKADHLPSVVSAVKKYITLRFSEHVSLEILAKEFNINKYYLHKLFKRCTGQTPNELLLQTRISVAKELLRTTELSVEEIAERVGIYNCSHFINTFKKYEHTTPLSYRKQWNNI